MSRAAIGRLLAIPLLIALIFCAGLMGVSSCQSRRSHTKIEPSITGRWDHAPQVHQRDEAYDYLATVHGSEGQNLSFGESRVNFHKGRNVKRVDDSEAPIGARPVMEEELWVIARRTIAAPPDGGGEYPGTGAMVVDVPDAEEHVPLPLKHTHVDAGIAGYIATVSVTQQFHNPFDSKIEASYVFPLPQNAAINEFVMTIGERRIRGIIRKREEAERIYHEARAQGHVASLLTQERPNIFTQKVANIEPGKQIDVDITYFHTLRYVDGWYEYVFPMVVGPRFNPPGFTEGVGAVGRGKHGLSGQATEVQYLAPHERSGHDISLTVDLNVGVDIEELQCPSHVIATRARAPGRTTVQLSDRDSIPNKDFVLRYRVAGEQIKSAFLAHRDRRGGFFTLMILPPQYLRTLPRQPMEMVFVLDCSGSMSGRPIAQAKTAVERALRHMDADDTFQVIRFSNDASQLGPAPIQATAANSRRGLDYVRGLHGRGGTMMIEGVKAALDFPHDPQRLRVVAFLTDGYIGNERQILGEVYRRVGPARVFSFGVGSSTNRYLLDRMALAGRGAVAYLGPNDSAANVMDDYFGRISHPAMTDVEVDWGNLDVRDVYPERVPDLIVGRPVVLTGRFDGDGRTTIRVHGRAGDRDVELNIPIDVNEQGPPHHGIAAVWARMKIADIYDEATFEDMPDAPQRITAVALEHGLMSAYTAFVAVDATRRTAGQFGTTVPVPVSVPEGVRYETTVEN